MIVKRFMMSSLFYAHRLKEIREARGYTQSFLADRIEISPNAICSFENGTKHPSPETLSKLCRALDVPYHFFQTDKLQKPPRTTPLTYRRKARACLKDLNQIHWLEEWLSDIQSLFSQSKSHGQRQTFSPLKNPF